MAIELENQLIGKCTNDFQSWDMNGVCRIVKADE